MIPAMLRLAVLARRISTICCSPVSMTSWGVLCAASTTASWRPNLARRVAAGASGIRTGSSVTSLTSSATCWRRNKPRSTTSTRSAAAAGRSTPRPGPREPARARPRRDRGRWRATPVRSVAATPGAAGSVDVTGADLRDHRDRPDAAGRALAGRPAGLPRAGLCRSAADLIEGPAPACARPGRPGPGDPTRPRPLPRLRGDAPTAPRVLPPRRGYRIEVIGAALLAAADGAGYARAPRVRPGLDPPIRRSGGGRGATASPHLSGRIIGGRWRPTWSSTPAGTGCSSGCTGLGWLPPNAPSSPRAQRIWCAGRRAASPSVHRGRCGPEWPGRRADPRRRHPRRSQEAARVSAGGPRG